jgi:hypothetical protein
MSLTVTVLDIMEEEDANSVNRVTVNPQRDYVEGTLNSTCNEKRSKACFKSRSISTHKNKAFSLFH